MADDHVIDMEVIIAGPGDDLALLNNIFERYSLADFNRLDRELKANLKALGHIHHLDRLERASGQELAVANDKLVKSLRGGNQTTRDKQTEQTNFVNLLGRCSFSCPTKTFAAWT